MPPSENLSVLSVRMHSQSYNTDHPRGVKQTVFGEDRPQFGQSAMDGAQTDGSSSQSVANRCLRRLRSLL